MSVSASLIDIIIPNSRMLLCGHLTYYSSAGFAGIKVAFWLLGCKARSIVLTITIIIIL